MSFNLGSEKTHALGFSIIFFGFNSLGNLGVRYTNLELLALNSVATLFIVFNSENHLAVAKIQK
jgi:hypothetical protein